MKSNILLATACLAIGASAAWFLKPDSTANDSRTGDSGTESGTAGSSERQKREVSERTVLKSDRNSADAPPADLSAFIDGGMGGQMVSMFKKRQLARTNARIAKLVAQLNLTPDQEAALRKAAGEKIAGFDDLFSEGFDPSKLGGMLGQDGIDQALADILTPEQKEELEAVKKREIANKVEARALQELAKLSDLDLTQEQKDAAYDILYKQAEAAVDDGASQNGLVSVLANGFGIEVGDDALGLATAIIPDVEELAQGDFDRDPEALMRMARERMTKQVDDQVEAMRPVLNEAQLEQYRKSLELKQGGFLGGFKFQPEELGGDTSGDE